MLSKTFSFLINLNLFFILPNFCFTQSPQILANIQINFSNNGTHTSFILTSTQSGTTLSNSWVAVGFNIAPNMAGTDLIMCQNPSSGSPVIQHRYATAYALPNLLDSTNPTVGISSSSVLVSGNSLVCSFTRQNSNTNINYFNINLNSPYLIAAYGPISNGVPLYHTARAASTTKVSIPLLTTTTTTLKPTTITTTTTTTTPKPNTTTTTTTTTTPKPNTTTATTTTTTTTLKPTTTTATTTTATPKPTTTATTTTTTTTTTPKPTTTTATTTTTTPKPTTTTATIATTTPKPNTTTSIIPLSTTNPVITTTAPNNIVQIINQIIQNLISNFVCILFRKC